MAALDLGYTAGVEAVCQTKPQVLYLLGADEGLVTRSELAPNAFIIYQGNVNSLIQCSGGLCSSLVLMHVSEKNKKSDHQSVSVQPLLKERPDDRQTSPLGKPTYLKLFLSYMPTADSHHTCLQLTPIIYAYS